MSKISIAGLAAETGLSKHAVRGRIVRDGLSPIGVDQDGRSNLYDRGAALCSVMGDERSEDTATADKLAEAEKALATVREAKASALANLHTASQTIRAHEGTIGRLQAMAVRDQALIDAEYMARIEAERVLRDVQEQLQGERESRKESEQARRRYAADLDVATGRAALFGGVAWILFLMLAVVALLWRVTSQS